MLVKIESINLERNLIKKLPQRIGELKRLKELLLSENNIEYLPESIGDLTSL